MLACPTLRTRPPERRPGRLARPCLEALEDRNAPATLSLSVSYNPDQTATLHGTLTDTATPGNQLITVMGAESGQTVTDAAGHFSLNTTPSSPGVVYAWKTDGSSNVAEAPVADAAPVITMLSANEGADRMWTITGTVTFPHPFESMTVDFGGTPVSISGKTTTAGSDGAFSLTVQLSGTQNDNGTMWAEAVSPWGVRSARAYQLIEQTGT